MPSLVEILLSVAFPLLVTLGVSLALSDASITEFWVARICFAVSAADLLGLSAYWLTSSSWPILARLVVAAFIGVIVVPATVGSLTWINYRQDKLNRERIVQPVIQPDVTLRLVYLDRPALVLINNSGVVAKEIKWTVLLWNLDQPRAYSAEFSSNPDAHEPLQIPVSTFDFIRPHSRSGPMNLFGTSLVAPNIKDGDRLFGSMSVVCPECSRGHTYLVSITLGKGGWSAEVTSQTNGDLIVPPKMIKAVVAKWVEEITARIGPSERIPIEQQ